MNKESRIIPFAVAQNNSESIPLHAPFGFLKPDVSTIYRPTAHIVTDNLYKEKVKGCPYHTQKLRTLHGFHAFK